MFELKLFENDSFFGGVKFFYCENFYCANLHANQHVYEKTIFIASTIESYHSEIENTSNSISKITLKYKT